MTGRASSNRVRVAAQAWYDSGSAYGWNNLSPEGQAYWMRRVQVVIDALDAISNREASPFDRDDPTWPPPTSQPEHGIVGPDATRNRVPTEAELAEVMAACWDNPGFRSNREANGYPKMAKALRAYLLERAT